MNFALPLLRTIAILVVAISLQPAVQLVSSMLKLSEITEERELRLAKAVIKSCTFVALFGSAFAIIGDPISPAVLLLLLACYAVLSFFFPSRR